jgi:hypothetical protein
MPERLRASFALATLFLAVSMSAHGQMYRWTDKDGKVHYSDKPPPAGAKQQTTKPLPSRVPPAEAKDTPRPPQSAAAGEVSSGSRRPWSRAEEHAGFCVLFEINAAQIHCGLGLGRFCTIDEMIKGGGPQKTKLLGKDPRLDPNYEHRIAIGPETYTWSAVPRRPGFTGFFYNGRRTYYNPNGAASDKDKAVLGEVDCK